MIRYSDTLTPELSALILQYIDSVPHLEALVLMWESEARPWSENDVARRIYQTVDATRSILRDLQRHGLIAPAADGADRYRVTADPCTRDIVTRIVTAYKNRMSQVAMLIHSRAPHPVREFARAFEIRGKEKK